MPCSSGVVLLKATGRLTSLPRDQSRPRQEARKGAYFKMSRSWFAGLCAIAFAVLTFVGSLIDSGPGGTYKASDVTKYLESGHRPVVFVASYMALLGIWALFVLLTWLRTRIGDTTQSSVFWALSVAGAGTFIAGWALHTAVPLAIGYGGKSVTVAPAVTYVFNTGGYIVLSSGAFLIGLALLTLAFGRVALPGWVRVITGVGAVGALTSAAFFPFGLFFLWALAIGIWLLVARPAPAAAPATA